MDKVRTRRTGWLLAALALLAVIAGGATWAATHSVETEVRIAAQRLNDGRVEFALQQRIGGEWSDRIKPSGRYLPVNAPTDRWLRSTPVTLAVAVPESATANPQTGQLDSTQPPTHRAEGAGTGQAVITLDEGYWLASASFRGAAAPTADGVCAVSAITYETVGDSVVRRARAIASQTQPFILYAAGLEGELHPLPAGEVTVFGNRQCAGVSWALEFRRLGDLSQTPTPLSGPSLSGTLPPSGNAAALITLTPGTYRCTIEGSEGIAHFRIFGIDEHYIQHYDPEHYRRRAGGSSPGRYDGSYQGAVYVWYWHHRGESSSSDVPVSSTRYVSVPVITRPTSSSYRVEVNPPDDIYYFWVDGEQGTNWSFDCQRRS